MHLLVPGGVPGQQPVPWYPVEMVRRSRRSSECRRAPSSAAWCSSLRTTIDWKCLRSPGQSKLRNSGARQFVASGQVLNLLRRPFPVQTGGPASGSNSDSSRPRVCSQFQRTADLERMAAARAGGRQAVAFNKIRM